VTLQIRRDDLSGAATQALVAAHRAGMRATSPEDSCHVLDLEALRDPSITFWSAWEGDDLAGIGALKDLGEGRGELKSMRVDDRFRGTGVGRAMLRHLVAAASALGMRSLWLETGASEEFVPARRLYAAEGFTECGPFDAYVPDRHSVFMTRTLVAPAEG
jgi:putative acetyltransferase